MNEAEHSGNANLPIGGEAKDAIQENGVPDGVPDGGPGWHSRGYLPHFDSTEATQHVTFHLADSLPRDVLARLDAEVNRLPLHKRRLLAWVVMPNHVHVLFQPINGWTVAKIVASWKKFTARKICEHRRKAGNANLPNGEMKKDANQEIGVPGNEPVWHRKYWDRYMRNENHFQQAVEYIHQNPVKAGLVAQAQDWRWSSAYPGVSGRPN